MSIEQKLDRIIDLLEKLTNETTINLPPVSVRSEMNNLNSEVSKDVQGEIFTLDGTVQEDGSIICNPMKETRTTVGWSLKKDDTNSLLPEVNKSISKQNNIDSFIPDTQTKNISQGINLLLCYYPEAKLLVGYDQEIVVVLPYTERVTENVSDTLKLLGWEHLEFLPWMWQYRAEGYVYDYYKDN